MILRATIQDGTEAGSGVIFSGGLPILVKNFFVHSANGSITNGAYLNFAIGTENESLQVPSNPNAVERCTSFKVLPAGESLTWTIESGNEGQGEQVISITVDADYL